MSRRRVILHFIQLNGEQIRAGRALARIEQAELARRSGLSLETVKRLERFRGPVEANTRTLTAIVAAFAGLGIVFDSSVANELVVRRVSPVPTSTAPLLDVHVDDQDSALHRVIFYGVASSAAVAATMDTFDKVEMMLLERSKALGVTGLMFACQGRFLGVLEGSKEAVWQIYGGIAADPRHSALDVIENRPVNSRQFADWRFCCGLFPSDEHVFSYEPGMTKGFDPEGLSPASAVGLLSLVRDLERADPRRTRGELRKCRLINQCLDQVCTASVGKVMAE